MIKIGAFYQSGFKYVACYMALQQLRKIYPSIPIALYEDGSNILESVAIEFNCDYKKTSVNGVNLSHSGRPVKDLNSNLMITYPIGHLYLLLSRYLIWWEILMKNIFFITKS